MADKSKVKVDVDLPEGVERVPTKPGGPHTNDDPHGDPPPPPPPPSDPKQPPTTP